MTTQFHDVSFPARLAIAVSGGPEDSVDVVRLASGQERRNSRWSAPLRRYLLSIGARPMAEIKQIVEFFETRRGPLHAFRFRDPFNHSTAAEGADVAAMDVELGTADGAQTSFPLALANARQIQKPVAGTVLVAVDGVTINNGFSVDFDNGLVEFFSPPDAGSVVSAGFIFDVPVRFENEELIVTRSANGAAEIADFSLREVRL